MCPVTYQTDIDGRLWHTHPIADTTFGRRRLRETRRHTRNVSALPLNATTGAAVEFLPAKFLEATNEQRAALCREFAADAERLGHAAKSGELREAYLALAKSWSELAVEMESMLWSHHPR